MLTRIKQIPIRSKLWQSILSIGDFFVLSSLKKNTIQSRNKRKTVLIVRLDAIGDFVLWLDAAKELRQVYPNSQYEITLIANEAWTQLANAIPFFDNVWPISRNKFYRKMLYRYGVLRQLRRSKFDIVIQASSSRRFYLHDAIVRFSNAPCKVGLTGDRSNISQRQECKSDRWYSKQISLSKDIVHELDRNAELVRGLAEKKFIAESPILKGSFPSEQISVRPYFVLFPGAGWAGRMWPSSRFREIAQRIYQETGWCCVICGGSGDENAAAKITKKQNITPMYNFTGKTSLIELVGIIQQARLVVANETSAIHIATAVSTPSVCILGGGHYGRFVPYPRRLRGNKANPIPVFREMECFGCNWECVFKSKEGEAMPCIKDISVEDTWSVVLKVIQDQVDSKEQILYYQKQ